MIVTLQVMNVDFCGNMLQTWELFETRPSKVLNFNYQCTPES